MTNHKLSRRGLLATTVGFLPLSGWLRAKDNEKEAASPKTARDSLERLRAGNQRFVSGQLTHPHQSKEWRRQLIQKQHPFATILGCSDSRVPPELLFDQGIGDLFVVRVAGNVIATEILGSMQYAVAHLRTPLIVVLGHEHCGAVSAALEAKFKKTKKHRYIDALVGRIEPGLKDVDRNLDAAAQLRAAVVDNVRWSMKQIMDTPEAQRAIRDKRDFRIVGAVYDLATGAVRWLDR